MTSLSSLNYRKLFLPAWTIPLQLTLAFGVVLYAGLSFVPPSKPCYSCTPVAYPAFDMAWRIALLIGVVGMLFGLYRNQKMRGLARKQFDVTYLPDHAPLTQRVHQLAGELGLPLPAVGTTAAVNAFAVGSGPKDAAVIIGQPLLGSLTPDELDAVIGHELGHIATNDMSRMQMAAGFQAMFEWMFKILGGLLTVALAIAASSSDRRARDAGDWIYIALGLSALANVTVGVVSYLLTLRLSRSREFYADAIGATLTSSGAMRGALERIHGFGGTLTESEKRYATMMFRTKWSGNVWSTHPSLSQRLRALETGAYIKAIERARGRADRAGEVLDRVKAEMTPEKLVAHGRTAYAFAKPRALELKEALPSRSFVTRIPDAVWMGGMFVLVAALTFALVRVLL